MPIFNFIGYTQTIYLENLTIDEKFINKRVRIFIHQTMYLKIEKKKIIRTS